MEPGLASLRAHRGTPKAWVPTSIPTDFYAAPHAEAGRRAGASSQ
jgi:hypothetical protein